MARNGKKDSDRNRNRNRNRNRILAALPAEDFARLEPDLDLISMPLGASVYEAGSAMKHLIFPTEGIISLLQVMVNGQAGEIAIVGSEGVVGIAMFMGGETTPSRAVVQSACEAWRLPLKALSREFKRGGDLQHQLLRYTQALITQMTQTAVCNRHHSVDQQLSRWLLMSFDRLPASELVMTQELIANMLGVRREGVTEGAGRLQKAGAIRYARGRIELLDRSKLEASVCECYSLVKTEYGRLLEGIY